MTAYWEKLRDPRWQRKRLEIMDASGFSCALCGADDKTLNVHHKIYIKGADPWDYKDEYLECLCEECHREKHEAEDAVKKIIAEYDVDWEQVLGYVHGLIISGNPDCSINIRSYFHAEGIGHALGVSADDIIGEANDDGMASFIALDALRKK